MQKKVFFRLFAFMAAAFFFFAAAVYAQSPLRIYVCQKGEVAAHIFSSSAHTYTFTEGTNLSTVWLNANGTTGTLNALPDAEATPQTFTGNIQIPEFYFGKAKVKYFGLTGAGCLYFGTDDAIMATSNPAIDMSGSGKLKNFVYLEFYNGTSDALWGKRAISTPVYAGANATAKYEIVDGTLFVGYENLKIYDNTNSATLPLSFQYKITSDGAITFIPVAMQPTGTTHKETGANYFLFDLALLPGGEKSNGVFLSDLNGAVENVYTWLRNPEIEITNESYPRGSYGFTQPAPCREIATPKVTRWSYAVTANTLEINPGTSYMAWEEGSRCVLILSPKASLTGNDLPQNGTEYSDIPGLKIGSSVFAAVAQVDPNYGSYLRNNSVSGLTPDTRYYLYAFPYNDDCSNFKYNTTNIPRLEIKTAMATPTSLRVEESSITSTGYTVLVDKAGNNPYLLGVSERQISSPILLNNKIQSKQGGYAKGDVIMIGGEKVEVLAPCSTDASYRVDGLTAGTERWYYAWSTKADQSEYSYEPICRGFAASHTVPAEVNFDAAAPNVDMSGPSAGGPAGWLFGNDNDYPFYIYDRAGVGRFLSVQMQRSNSGSVAHSTAVSPLFESGELHRVGVTFNLYFWRNGEVLGEYLASAPNRTDTLYIQYCLSGQDAWTTIATVTNATSVNGGELSVKASAFETAGKNFRLRVLVASNHMPVGRETANYVSIRSISVYTPCSAVSGLQVSDVMHNSGLVTWEDRVNTPRAGSYSVAWSRSDLSGTQQNVNVLVRETTLKGLVPNTSYEVSVRAVCGAGDTSVGQMLPFTTHRGLPYTLKTTSEGSMPEEITFRTGNLPSTGNAVLNGTDADKSVWEGNAQETDNTRIALNIATANNPLWLRLPVLSVGNIRGKAHFEAVLSKEGAFNTADTLFVLLSTDSVFSRSEVLGLIGLGSLEQVQKLDFEFEVKTSYLYVAILTKFGETSETGTLLADGVKVEWTDIYCDPVKSLRSSHLTDSSVDISWSGEGVKFALLYREDGTEKWDTVITRENTAHLDTLKGNTTYEYYVLTYCDEENRKVSDKSITRIFTTLNPCDVPILELMEGTETTEGIVVIVTSPAPQKQLQIRPADLEECPYQMDVMNLQRDTTIVRGLTDCEAVTYYVKARAVCPSGVSEWTEEQTFTTLKPNTDNFPLEKANASLRVRVTSDEIILENYTGEYVKELQAFSTTGRLLAVFPVNSAADVRLAHHLPQGTVLLRAVSENAGTTTFKIIIL